MDPGTLGVDLCALGFHLVGLEVGFGFSASESLFWEWIRVLWAYHLGSDYELSENASGRFGN